MSDVPQVITPELLQSLHQAAAHLHQNHDWGVKQSDWLKGSGATGWTIPAEFGGTGRDTDWILNAYQQMASACLTTTFVLTQFHAACQRIIDAPVTPIRDQLLRDLATCRQFATVGISHLSTSRQHLKRPAVSIIEQGTMLQLNGSVPWVTAAPIADVMVTGGTCDDGQQMLVALPLESDGVTIAPPANLLALSESQTASVTLENVRISREFLLSGPTHRIMKTGSGGTGSVTTSALALGLADRAIQIIEYEQQQRPQLAEVTAAFRSQLSAIRQAMGSLTSGRNREEVTSETIRQQANDLVLRASQAALTATKGAGFVSGHRAEQTVREAMFFLVWSCPQPVAAAALQQFACLD